MLLLLSVLFWVWKPNEMCSVHQIAINHIPLWIIPSDSRSIAVQNPPPLNSPYFRLLQKRKSNEVAIWLPNLQVVNELPYAAAS